MANLIDESGKKITRGLYTACGTVIYVNNDFAEFSDGSRSTLHSLLTADLIPLQEPQDFVESLRRNAEFIEKKLKETNQKPLDEEFEREENERIYRQMRGGR